MCVLSMVLQDYTSIPEWPWNDPSYPGITIKPLGPGMYQPPTGQTNIVISSMNKEDVDRLEKLITEFKEAVTLATRLDVLTKKSDCVDPEKAKLIERVAELETQLMKIKDVVNPVT